MVISLEGMVISLEVVIISLEVTSISSLTAWLRHILGALLLPVPSLDHASLLGCSFVALLRPKPCALMAMYEPAAMPMAPTHLRDPSMGRGQVRSLCGGRVLCF